MANALWITLIGMGLVFVAILALWGLMALLVYITGRFEPAEGQEPETAEPEADGAPVDLDLSGRKRQAAAAAVAVALASVPARASAAAQRQTAGPGTVSAWQAVQRAGQLSQRINTNRKKVQR